MCKKIIFAAHDAMRWIFIQLIKIYQKCVSPFLGNHCRFHPSCSEYAKEAISTFSLSKGLYLILQRLLRCHPFCKGGFDPVISAKNQREIFSHTDTSHSH